MIDDVNVQTNTPAVYASQGMSTVQLYPYSDSVLELSWVAATS